MAATTDKQILQVLQQLENHARKASGDSSRMMAKNSNGGENSPLEDANKGLIKSFYDLHKNLKKNNEAAAKATKERDKEIAKNKNANKALDDLTDTIKTQLAEGKKVAQINRKVRKTLKDLGEIGNDLGASFATIKEQNKGEYLASIEANRNELNKHSDALERNRKASEGENQRNREDAEDSKEEVKGIFSTGMKAMLGTFMARGAMASSESQSTGFQFDSASGSGDRAGTIGGSIRGFFGEAVEAFQMGASIEDVQRFASANRNALTAATRLNGDTESVLLTAREGAEAVTGYGETLLNTFGFSGQSQLNAISQSLTTLTNLGVTPTIGNMEKLAQTVENLQKTTDATADQLFAEFTTLSEDSGFQNLFSSMGGSADIFDQLGTSFLTLQKSVKLNLREFTAYQKILADQNSRTGSQRQVEGAFVASLANSIGGRSQNDLDLLQQGATFYESLGVDERGKFDELINKLNVDITATRNQALKDGRTAVVENIDIQRQNAGVFLSSQLAGVAGRNRSGVSDAAASSQEERLAAAGQETEKVVEVVSDIQEILKGFANSPFAGAGYFGQMAGAVFKGSLAARIAAPAALAALALGAGVVGAGALGEFLGETLHGKDDGSDSLLSAVNNAREETDKQMAENAKKFTENELRMQTASANGNLEIVTELQRTNELLVLQNAELKREEGERIFDIKNPSGDSKNKGSRKR